MRTNLSFAKHAEELFRSTDGLESHSIMLVPSPVICEHFVFPYLHTFFYDMASPSRAVMLAALILMRNKISHLFHLFKSLLACNLSQRGRKVKKKTQKSNRGMSDTDSGRTREMIVIPREN